MFKKYFGIVFVLLLAFYAMQPLFVQGFFPIHDDEQVGRLFELNYALQAGHFPVRLAQHLGFGFDYPLFNFYPSFIYYLAELFHIVGFSYIVSIKIMIGLGFLLAAFFMYSFARKYLGVIGSIVAAVAYTYAPYHSVDVFVRGALPEFWSFVFIPAIFWAYASFSEARKTIYAVLAGIFCALLVLTHNLVALMASPFIALYLLYLLLQTPAKKSFILGVVVSSFFAICLPASFWLPAVFERQYTMVSLLTTELADYAIHFVYIRQLWDSPWGYGGSLYGLYDGLSFQIGKLHIVGAVIALVISFILFKKQRKKTEVIILFFLLFLFACFMTTFYSKPIWDSIQPLSYVQFPWRFLLFTAFTSSFLLGFLPGIIKEKKFQMFSGILLVAGIVFLNKNYFVPSKYLTSVTDESYTNLHTLKWKTSKMAFEYVPIGIKTKISDVKTTIIAIDETQVASSSYKIVKGKARVTVVTDKPQEKVFKILAHTQTRLQINTFTFPGWKVFVNSKEVSYQSYNAYKLITIDVPKGTFTIRVIFTDTPVRIVGNDISLIAWLLLICYLAYNMYGSFQKKGKKENEKKKN